MNPSKAKGTSAETAVVLYLREHGFEAAERRTTRGAKDCGDVAGIPGVTIEVKACKEQTLAKWIDEAEEERANMGDELGVVWHKRRMKGSAGEWFVTMTGEQFVALLTGP